MSESTAAHGEVSYTGYWIAWAILLVLTVAMIAVANPTAIVVGIVIKASIIALWFMHLKFERISLGVVIAVASIVTTLVLFGLIAVDAVGTGP
jgi:4-hydroxybenzoate polyprenyltransferase